MEYPHDRSYEDYYADEFLALKDDVLRAAASTIDSPRARRYEIRPGQPEYWLYWNAEGFFNLLKSKTVVIPRKTTEGTHEFFKLKDSAPGVRFEIEYSLSRSKSLPHLVKPDFIFSTSSSVFSKIDSNGLPILSYEAEENWKTLREVAEILDTRSDKVPLDETIQELEMSYYLEDEYVKQYIARMRQIGKHLRVRQHRQNYLTKDIVGRVMAESPLFTQEMFEERLVQEVDGHEAAA